MTRFHLLLPRMLLMHAAGRLWKRKKTCPRAHANSPISVGWVPVDASEAWKNPAKRDFFFGAHDTNRVFFTYGRDIRLSPDQKGDPLNYFIYPYAETNGQPVKNLQTHFSFRDVSAAQLATAGR